MEIPNVFFQPVLNAALALAKSPLFTGSAVEVMVFYHVIRIGESRGLPDVTASGLFG